MKQTLCQYGNCTLESSRICVTRDMNPGERSYFCSEVHAALYLLEREGHRQLANEVETILSNAGGRHKRATLCNCKASARDGQHMSWCATQSTSVQCPHCIWGFDPSVIDQHIREKHS